MNKNEFIKQAIADVVDNPRAALQGHRIKPAILKSISEREDVIAKIATIAFSLKNRKKKSGALRKQPGFQIFSYLNHNKFRKDSVKNIELMKSGTNDTFFPSENCIVIVMKFKSNTENAELTDIVKYGESTALPYKQAVSTKIPGAMYIMVAFTGEQKLPTEERKALTAKAREAKLVGRKTRSASLIARDLKNKSKRLNSRISTKDNSLKLKQAGISQGMTQAGNLLGRKRKLDRPETFVKARREYNKTAGKLANTKLTPSEEKAIKLARKAQRVGDTKMANYYFRRIKDVNVREFYKNGGHKNADSVLKAEASKIRKEIKSLGLETTRLMDDLSNGIGSSRSNKLRITKNNKRVELLRAKLGTFKNINQKALRALKRSVANSKLEIVALLERQVSLDMAIDKVVSRVKGNSAAKDLVKETLVAEVSEKLAEVTEISESPLNTTALLIEVLTNDAEVEYDVIFSGDKDADFDYEYSELSDNFLSKMTAIVDLFEDDLDPEKTLSKTEFINIVNEYQSSIFIDGNVYNTTVRSINWILGSLDVFVSDPNDIESISESVDDYAELVSYDDTERDFVNALKLIVNVLKTADLTV